MTVKMMMSMMPIMMMPMVMMNDDGDNGDGGDDCDYEDADDDDEPIRNQPLAQTKSCCVDVLSKMSRRSLKNTKWCQFVFRSHKCRYGDGCNHAHTWAEYNLANAGRWPSPGEALDNGPQQIADADHAAENTDAVAGDANRAAKDSDHESVDSPAADGGVARNSPCVAVQGSEEVRNMDAVALARRLLDAAYEQIYKSCYAHEPALAGKITDVHGARIALEWVARNCWIQYDASGTGPPPPPLPSPARNRRTTFQ